MDKYIAFSVYQYAYGEKEINESFEDLIRYMKRNHIVLGRGQMVITGRVLGNLKIGDILTTSNDTLVEVKGFHAYGAEFDFMSAGMTCALFTDSLHEKLTENQSLYFVNR